MQWNDDLKFILADELNLTDGFIEQVLKFLLDGSLFDNKLFQSDTILDLTRNTEEIPARSKRAGEENSDPDKGFLAFRSRRNGTLY